MALTAIEKARIRQYLGFSTANKQWNPRLESRMSELDEADLSLTREILQRIQRVECELAPGSSAMSSEGVKKVDEVEFFGPHEGGSRADRFRKTGQNFCSQLSIKLGVPLVGNYFGTGGYAGDGWMSSGFQNGPARPIRLG